LKILVIQNQSDPRSEPWWVKHVRPCAASKGITLHTRGIRDSLGALAPLDLWRVLVLVLVSRGYDWVLTPQDGLSTICLGIAGRLLPFRRPRHGVLEFLTREKGTSLYDRMKYALLRLSLKKVDRLICSSRVEMEYYKEQLGLTSEQVGFVLLGGDPGWRTQEHPVLQDYILSAGRTLRDYATLLKAVEGTGIRLLVITSPACVADISVPPNVEMHFDIEPSHLSRLMEHARFVVLPLQNRKISCGQRVLVMAMAEGKCCVVSRVPGMLDYVRDGEDGLFVEPYDIAGLRTAITDLWQDFDRISSIGDQARASFESNYRIERHAESVLRVLQREPA
jgi:glycosyltransferase involved in cell wall biosynthesis